MDAIRNILIQARDLLGMFAQTVTVWDVLDILIVAFVIYKILTILQRTSAGSVTKGIIFIMAIAGISNVLNMTIISYFLEQFMRMGVVILIVLFQPEIRKLFEQMGSSKLSVMFRKRVKIENIEAAVKGVVNASMEMAKSGTGALIVFEREVGLNDYATSGTLINADVSSELIQNIFYNNSPLHDGAVIIRDGKILAAACMMPLSTNINLSRDLGMRHRAGIGISERSDAIAVIISEQTGTISVAIDGMLKRHLTKDTFEKLLENELTLKMQTSELKTDKLKVKK